MAYAILPANPDLGPQTFTSTLGGTRFRVRIFWVQLTESWYFHLETVDGTRLLSGVRLVPFNQLLRQYASLATLPEGEFLVADMEGGFDNMERDDLGGRHLWLFIPDDETEEAFGDAA